MLERQLKQQHLLSINKSCFHPAPTDMYLLRNSKPPYKTCPTQRAPDWWEAARFQAVRVA